jgi:peptide-methionine (S)-S-oxide reductase
MKRFALLLTLLMPLMHNLIADDPSAAPSLQSLKASTTATATLGGGCFWCLEAVFQSLPGITKITSGFAGGTTPHPTYDQVCTGRTGHAEVIQITYNPAKVSYNQLLDLFWRAHDPTTLNRQGADTGTQYRSIILTSTPEQAILAEASRKKAAAQFPDPIVTEIEPLVVFYPAENYHQNYYSENKEKNPYCQVVIAPKLKKLGLPQ